MQFERSFSDSLLKTKKKIQTNKTKQNEKNPLWIKKKLCLHMNIWYRSNHWLTFNAAKG